VKDRLVRSRQLSRLEERWTVGGLLGAVTCHAQPGGRPMSIVLHSAAERPEWDEPHPCPLLESPCWYVSSDGDDDLSYVLAKTLMGMCDPDGDEFLWAVLEQLYRDYLAGRG
jgi:hypothetical protein